MTLTLSLLYLAACRPQEVDLPFETVERANGAGTGEYYEDEQPKLVVITEAGKADVLGNTVSLDAQAQLRDLDFDRYFVITVFEGQHPNLSSLGFGVEIQRISKKGSTIAIYAHFYGPREGYQQEAIEISPYHLVKMRKGEDMQGEFEFVLNVDGADVVRQAHLIP